jgi:hypothetical protein
MAENGSKIDNHLRIGKPKLDPLGAVPDAGHALFKELSAQCSQFPLPAVINGCSALLLNAIRQRNTTRTEAEADFNEMYGRMKSLLLAHYDGVSGKRRSIFPHHQIIEPPFVDLRPKNERK